MLQPTSVHLLGDDFVVGGRLEDGGVGLSEIHPDEVAGSLSGTRVVIDGMDNEAAYARRPPALADAHHGPVVPDFTRGDGPGISDIRAPRRPQTRRCPDLVSPAVGYGPGWPERPAPRQPGKPAWENGQPRRVRNFREKSRTDRSRKTSIRADSPEATAPHAPF